jgi:fluoride exporter
VEVKLNHIALVFIGGGIGSIFRYGISLASVRIWGASFPYGTLIVNIVGCFLIGLCFSLAENTKWFTPTARIFLMTGVMGGLTTFSSYGLESMNLALTGDRYSALFNILATNIGGLICVFFGLWAGKQI